MREPAAGDKDVCLSSGLLVTAVRDRCCSDMATRSILAVINNVIHPVRVYVGLCVCFLSAAVSDNDANTLL